MLCSTMLTSKEFAVGLEPHGLGPMPKNSPPLEEVGKFASASSASSAPAEEPHADAIFDADATQTQNADADDVCVCTEVLRLHWSSKDRRLYASFA
ncbi:MAG: hypothetical protein EPO21_15310 [Chloroflexota bacterium]|nr:MAG: hypothetical protein EPO21_15310 [Chloroflexota bacterium]